MKKHTVQIPTRLGACMLLVVLCLTSFEAVWGREALIVVGAPGDQEFADSFAEQGRLWEAACVQGNVNCTLLAPEGGAALPALNEALSALDPATETWVVLIGHGTWDGRLAKFNLKGQDLTAEALTEGLRAHEEGLVVINTSASSAPFLKLLSKKGRIVVTSTKSGDQINATHFGRFLAPLLTDADADLDGDAQVSLLEAVLTASRRVEEFFETEERLLTEHVLIEDNGDRVGTRADWYRGIQLEKRPKGEKGVADGYRAGQMFLVQGEEEAALSPEQRALRNALELEIFELRDRRKQLGDKGYYAALEEKAKQLAAVYRQETASERRD